MKKAVLISGVIWGILSILSALVFLILALVFGVAQSQPDMLNQMAQDLNVNKADLEAVIAASIGVFVFFLVYCVAGAVFSFVLVGLRNKQMSKGAGIGLGVVAIVLEAILPGIFFIVLKTRPEELPPSQPAAPSNE